MNIRAQLVTSIGCVLVMSASPATSGPLTDLLKARQVEVDRLLKTETAAMTKLQRSELADVLSAVFDFTAMAKEALRDQWTQRTAEEQKAFAIKFGRMVRANSIKSVDVYRSSGIVYGEETLDVAAGAGKVKISVESKAAVTEVDYSFQSSGDRWWIVDYRIDGVSAVRNYRRQFTKILEKDGWPGLMKTLDDRVAELEAAI